jgi:hypothetical protein
MEPSHARRYKNSEIEVIVAKIISEAYPAGISIPVDIDWLAERSELVDNIIPADLLEDKFKVPAALVSKSSGHADIFVDDDTITFQRARANFSIELGHVVLHAQVWESCHTIEDSIVLRNRITRAYNFIERNTNYFAGAILIPKRTIVNDTTKVYEFLTKERNYHANLILNKLCAILARRYMVNTQPMQIRLEQLNLMKKIQRALHSNSPYLDT